MIQTLTNLFKVSWRSVYFAFKKATLVPVSFPSWNSWGEKMKENLIFKNIFLIKSSYKSQQHTYNDNRNCELKIFANVSQTVEQK